MKAGIVIITYNNGQHVTETIKSVVSQVLKEWTCVVVDNSSTDNTYEVIIDLIGSNDKFLVLKKENEGPSAARNLGFSKLPSETEYIHFLDGDDVLDPNFMEVLVKYLDEHQEVGLVGCQYNVIDSGGNLVGPGFRSRVAPSLFGIPWNLSQTTKRTPFETFFSSTGQGHFSVFRTEIFKKTTGYEKDFWSHEDSDIFCQMALRAEVHYIDNRLYNRRIHGNSLTSSRIETYGAFRNKWDNYKTSDAAVNALVEKSLIYYYTRHKPLRDLKVSLKAFSEFVKTQKIGSLRWCLVCLKSGLSELILKRSLRKVLYNRAVVGKVTEDTVSGFVNYIL
ncbi:glycosyltransferase family 2 protein [Pontibacter sp. MBLB2868]|uniref:glycosyltransferase family 2 protein n=1 Tax=Pontibacter sp. MBLB2868 TaxID=3451555 RepID=UPI003F750C3C